MSELLYYFTAINVQKIWGRHSSKRCTFQKLKLHAKNLVSISWTILKSIPTFSFLFISVPFFFGISFLYRVHFEKKDLHFFEAPLLARVFIFLNWIFDIIVAFEKSNHFEKSTPFTRWMGWWIAPVLQIV